MATRTKKMGIGAIAIGAFDWFARYQTGKDLIATVSTQHVASLASTWWLSPAIIIVGFLILYADKVFARNTDDSDTPAPTNSASVRDSGNSTANATGGSITQHFHGSTQAAPIADPPKIVPIPVIERLDIRSAKILQTNSRANKWIEHDGGFSAHIVELRNRHAAIGKEGAAARSVVARLIFTPRNDKRVINNAACWLDEATQSATIAPGELRKLIIAVDLRMGGLCTLYNPREYITPVYSARLAMRSIPKPIEPLEISSTPCDVELALISSGNVTLYNEHYELQWSEGIIRLLPKRTQT